MNLPIRLFALRESWKNSTAEEYVNKYIETAQIVESTLRKRLSGETDNK